MYESVAIVVGKLVFDREVKAFATISYERNDVAAIAHALNMYTTPPRISYVSAVVGVNDRGALSHMVGVVPAVFATMKRSSTFHADFPIILILKP